MPYLNLQKIPKIFFILFLAVVTNLSISLSARALDIPPRPQGYVTDLANIISQNTENRLENALKQFELKTSDQIVVVTFESLENEALEDFSIRLAEKWKVGQKNKDNGVILLVFQKEHKIRLEVGYGLEGALTDAESGLIIHQVIAPYFQQNQFDQGIIAGVVAIIKSVEGEFQSTNYPSRGTRQGYRRQLSTQEIAAIKKQSQIIGLLVLVIAGILFIFDYFRYLKYVSTHRSYSQRYSFWEWFFRFAILLAVISMLFRMLFYMMLFSRGGYGGSRGGGGGFSGGGGSFGGGGASGGW